MTLFRPVLILVAATAIASSCSATKQMSIGAGDSDGTETTAAPDAGAAACTTKCPSDQDCVNDSCVSRVGGTCSASSDCSSNATCCDGAQQRCEATRLPAGDGPDSGQFVISTDGLSVADTITGLVWQRDASGPRDGCAAVATCTLAEAKTYCAALVLGGVSGWRVPARMELLTIVDFTRQKPSIDPIAFPNTPAEWFWISGPCPAAGGSRCYVNFNYGYSYDTDVGDQLRVRCVR